MRTTSFRLPKVLLTKLEAEAKALLIPVSGELLRRTMVLVRSAPKTVPLRAGDAIHLASALEAGEPEMWTNDRHLLAAAAHFGITPRSL